MPCKYCQKDISNKGSLAAHEKRCPLNPGQEVWDTNPYFRDGMTPWNKGLTKETCPSIAIQAEKSSKTLTGRPGVKHSLETRLLLSKLAIERGLGSKTDKPGWGKKGWFKGIWCDSSWELAFILHCMDKQLHVERAQVKLTYVHEGKTKCYYPDFLVEGVLTEVKGHPDSKWEAKKFFNPGIEVYDEERMIPILSWAKLTYGKNFTRLYDGKSDDGMSTPSKVGGYNALTPEEVGQRLKAIEDIDLTVQGWVKKVSDRLGLSHTQVRRFIDSHYLGATFTRRSSKQG